MKTSLAMGKVSICFLLAMLSVTSLHAQGICEYVNCLDGYTITDLGPLPDYAASYGYAINASGQVTGCFFGDDYYTLFFSGGTLHTLPLGPSCGFGINTAGWVTGHMGSGSDVTAFLYDGTLHSLGTLGGPHSSGRAINSSGVVAGYADTANGNTHAFIYDHAITDLGDLAGGHALSQAYAINTSGQVAGATTVSGGATHAFRYTAGVMQDLETPGGSAFSSGVGINDAGWVVGTSNDRAFLYDGHTMNDLGVLPNAILSNATAINTSGQVTGFSRMSADNLDHAFVYSNGSMKDLNGLIGTAFPEWILNSGTAINDAGQITGHGTKWDTAQTHAFLLTPIVNTSSGPNISVTPTDAGASGIEVTLTFSSVIQAGATILKSNTFGPQVPAGYKLGQPAVYFDLVTIAVYSGEVKVCASYANISYNNPSDLSIWHYDPGSATWSQLPTTIDIETSTACAYTNSLSPFAMLEPAYAADAQPPIGTDLASATPFSATRGVVPAKFTLKGQTISSCALPPASISLGRVSDGIFTPIEDVKVYLMSADDGSSFRIDSTACQYVYNIGSKSLGPGTYEVDIIIYGGIAGKGFFALK